MPVRNLSEYLNQHDVRYVAMNHVPAYTSQELAEVAHVSGHDIAKTVILNIDGQLTMAVLPACEKVDLRKVQEFTKSRWVSIAQESEFQNRFPLCELGGMPPFGNLYGMPVLVSSTLANEDVIAFNAGSHTELVKMSFDDYSKLVEPTILNFTLMH